MIISPRHRRDLVFAPTPIAPVPTPPAPPPSCSGWNCLATGQKAGIIVGIIAFVALLGLLFSFFYSKWLKKKDLEIRRIRRNQCRPRLAARPRPIPPPLPGLGMVPLVAHGGPPMLGYAYSSPTLPPPPVTWQQMGHPNVHPPYVYPSQQSWVSHPSPYHYAVPAAASQQANANHIPIFPAQIPTFPTPAFPARSFSFPGHIPRFPPPMQPHPSMQPPPPMEPAPAGPAYFSPGPQVGSMPPPPPSEADNGQDDGSDGIQRPDPGRQSRQARKRRPFWPFALPNRARVRARRQDTDSDADSNNAWAGSASEDDDDYIPPRAPSPRARESYPRELLTWESRRAWNQYNSIPMGRVSTVASDASSSRQASPAPSQAPPEARSGVAKENVPPAGRRSHSERRRAERRAGQGFGRSL